MSVSGTAISSALNALRMYSRRVDRAAETIAAAGLVDVTAPPADPDAGGGPTTPPPAPGPVMDLAGAMTDMMIAQRAFSAQLRVLRTADEMLRDTVDTIGGRR